MASERADSPSIIRRPSSESRSARSLDTQNETSVVRQGRYEIYPRKSCVRRPTLYTEESKMNRDWFALNEAAEEYIGLEGTAVLLLHTRALSFVPSRISRHRYALWPTNTTALAMLTSRSSAEADDTRRRSLPRQQTPPAPTRATVLKRSESCASIQPEVRCQGLRGIEGRR